MKNPTYTHVLNILSIIHNLALLCEASHDSEISNVGDGGVTSMMAGPYKIIGSVIEPLVLELDKKTYVWPMAVAGMVAAIIPPGNNVGVTDVVSRPETKTT